MKTKKHSNVRECICFILEACNKNKQTKKTKYVIICSFLKSETL